MTKQECITYVEAHLETRYATKNGAYKAKRYITPAGAVNHSIGVAQPSADVIFNLMNKESSGWGVNAILGDFHLGEGKIILAMPLTARPWGCGAGKNGSWNNSKVQWEVCEPAGHTYSGGTMVNYDVAKKYYEQAVSCGSEIAKNNLKNVQSVLLIKQREKTKKKTILITSITGIIIFVAIIVLVACLT